MDGFDDREYYARREQAERDLAARYSDESIGRIHRDMANLYSERAKQATVAQGPIVRVGS